jgi:hypothetical protein
MENRNLARTGTVDGTRMTKETRRLLAEIRKRDKALGQVATHSEAVAALNDCRALLAIIRDLQTDALERVGSAA